MTLIIICEFHEKKKNFETEHQLTIIKKKEKKKRKTPRNKQNT
jgi:hypothetical protein